MRQSPTSLLIANTPAPRLLARRLGKEKPSRHLNELMAKLVADGLVELTIPDKPNSRLQQYRLKGIVPDNQSHGRKSSKVMRRRIKP